MIDMKIEVKTTSLRATLMANKLKHETDLEKARALYFKNLLVRLCDEEDNAKLGKKVDLIKLYRDFDEPADHSGDYARVIGMLEMHDARTITLTAREYAQFVDDDWDWKQDWVSNSSKYR